MKFTEKYFFRRYGFDTAFKASLSEEAGLGAHGNVIVVAKGNAGEWAERHFIWSHIGARPWGIDVSQQCPGCQRLRTWTKPKIIEKMVRKKPVKHRIKLGCRFCNYSKEFDKPAGLTHDGAMAECGRGEWYFTRRVLSTS
jgi:hypothetical protein